MVIQEPVQLHLKHMVLPEDDGPDDCNEQRWNAFVVYSSGVGRLVELQVSDEDLALRLALRSVDAGR
ncbi:hypothetical protein, partial [Bradyrhizobium sp. F1.13.3]|uniref:hypothetical protein n=1 Tax=Bradyrhizobium sp. F1.13.3 TaxID=3156351 RepID=UPI00339974CF